MAEGHVPEVFEPYSETMKMGENILAMTLVTFCSLFPSTQPYFESIALT